MLTYSTSSVSDLSECTIQSEDETPTNRFVHMIDVQIYHVLKGARCTLTSIGVFLLYRVEGDSTHTLEAAPRPPVCYVYLTFVRVLSQTYLLKAPATKVILEDVRQISHMTVY